jgi:ABC-2 type transport system ATP-binding protein
LFSSHILQEVEAICDRVIIINKGSLVADDQLSRLKNNTSSNIIKVSFKAPVDRQVLQNLPAVTRVDDMGFNTWQLATEDPEGLKKQLLEVSLRNNLDVVSLQTENHSLEDIFRAFTGG